MTMLSDEELAAIKARYRLGEGWASGKHYQTQTQEDAEGMLAHIDALTAQRDRARGIAVSLEQGAIGPEEREVPGYRRIELKRTPAPIEERALDALLGFRVDPGADRVIAEFDAAAKALERCPDRLDWDHRCNRVFGHVDGYHDDGRGTTWQRASA